jgi:hypothetical protein
MTLTQKVVRGFKIAYPVFLEEAYAGQLVSLTARLQSLTLEHFKIILQC